MIITFRQIATEEEWQWVIKRIPLLLLPDMTSILAVNEKGELLAACVMDTWTETSCQVHFTIARPIVLRHGFFQEVSKFVFDDSGRLSMYGLVPANNEKALNLDKKIGFREVTRLKDAYKKGVDYVLLELKKSHCKFNAERG